MISTKFVLQAHGLAAEWRDTSAAQLLDKWMAGSPVGETVRDLLHALEPPPPRNAAQHSADTPQQATGAQLQQETPQRGEAAPQAEEMPQRDYRAAHWQQAMMQHKKAWRPEEWWNAARKRAHGHEQGGSKAERRRAEAASWRAAAVAQSEETPAQPQADVERLRVDDTQQAAMAEQVWKQVSDLLACRSGIVYCEANP